MPGRSVQRMNRAESIHVEVTVNDVRQVEDSLREVTARFCTAPAVTHEDLSQVIKSGVESESVWQCRLRLAVGLMLFVERQSFLLIAETHDRMAGLRPHQFVAFLLILDGLVELPIL